MERGKAQFQKYLFVCENEREGRACCGKPGRKLRDLLKDAIREKGFSGQIRVSRTGCLDVCQEGPNVLMMPDNVWFKFVAEKDIPEIVKKALEGVSA